MKIPKTRNRYCPNCDTHTEHRVTKAKKRTMGSVKTMSRGNRAKERHKKGTGNKGRYSRPPGGGKMTGKKRTKKTDLRYQCQECKKTWTQKKGKRSSRVELE